MDKQNISSGSHSNNLQIGSIHVANNNVYVTTSDGNEVLVSSSNSHEEKHKDYKILFASFRLFSTTATVSHVDNPPQTSSIRQAIVWLTTARGDTFPIPITSHTPPQPGFRVRLTFVFDSRNQVLSVHVSHLNSNIRWSCPIIGIVSWWRYLTNLETVLASVAMLLLFAGLYCPIHFGYNPEVFMSHGIQWVVWRIFLVIFIPLSAIASARFGAVEGQAKAFA